MLPRLVEDAPAQPLAPEFGNMNRLADGLRAAVSGDVRFDDGSRALYATDASNYRQVPIGVVVPRTTEEQDIHAGTPVIGLEPACVSVFRDELPNLFSRSEQAMRLQRQVFLLSEFLEQRRYTPLKLDRHAIVHAHCHHKALLKMDAEEAVLHKLGLDFRLLDSGCCGMAGSFGFEDEKYEVSMRCAERVLLPAVRDAGSDTLIVADGFSCREQIAQATGRESVHLAQVLRMALAARS